MNFRSIGLHSCQHAFAAGFWKPLYNYWS